MSKIDHSQFGDSLSVPVGEPFDGFETFIVGGAVRDALRGVSPSDIDLMAVPRPGEVDDPEAVLADRMQFVDPESSLPVFVDPRGREVALPRVEKDTGAGHRDFALTVVDPDTPVMEAVEVDLHRRDITVNAMAVNARTGELVDPHGGAADLDAGVIRHVSDAFRDDPLRVVRLARFAPRLNATVADETLSLARSMDADRLRTLPVERVTNEFRKAAGQAAELGRFVRVLDAADALSVLFPVLAEQNIDAVASTLTAVRNAVDANAAPFAAVLAALGDLLDADTDRFAGNTDLSRQEAATLQIGSRVVDDMAVFDQLPAREAVDAFGVVNSNRGAGPAVFVAAAAARHGIDREAVTARIAAVNDAVAAVDGASVMQEEGVTPGEDISGDDFANLLARRRAEQLSDESLAATSPFAHE